MLGPRAGLVWEVNSSRNTMVSGTGGGQSSGDPMFEASCDKIIPTMLAARAGLVREVNSSGNTMVIGPESGNSSRN